MKITPISKEITQMNAWLGSGQRLRCRFSVWARVMAKSNTLTLTLAQTGLLALAITFTRICFI